METLPPSPLEAALLKEFHTLYNVQGFPDPASIAIVGRTNTGGGRYVQLHFAGPPLLQNGYLDLGGKFIQIEGVPNGMMAVALVKDGRLVEIEIAVYGGDHWDGHERGWSFK